MDETELKAQRMINTYDIIGEIEEGGEAVARVQEGLAKQIISVLEEMVERYGRRGFKVEEAKRLLGEGLYGRAYIALYLEKKRVESGGGN